MKIAIAGTGYVGLSNAILLAQHNEDHKMETDPISYLATLHLDAVVSCSSVAQSPREVDHC